MLMQRSQLFVISEASFLRGSVRDLLPHQLSSPILLPQRRPLILCAEWVLCPVIYLLHDKTLHTVEMLTLRSLRSPVCVSYVFWWRASWFIVGELCVECRNPDKVNRASSRIFRSIGCRGISGSASGVESCTGSLYLTLRRWSSLLTAGCQAECN